MNVPKLSWILYSQLLQSAVEMFFQLISNSATCIYWISFKLLEFLSSSYSPNQCWGWKTELCESNYWYGLRLRMKYSFGYISLVLIYYKGIRVPVFITKVLNILRVIYSFEDITKAMNLTPDKMPVCIYTPHFIYF